MMDQLDIRIGEVLEKLKEKGIDDNTLIIFASDNGGVSMRQNGLPGPGYNGGLRDGKWSAFEGGIRVPFIISWPAVYPVGKTITHSVSFLDITPTLLRAAGYSGDSVKNLKFDGVDLHPWLTGKQNGPVHDILFWRYISDMNYDSGTIKYAVLKGNLKYNYLRAPGMPGVEYLFDLSKNRGEDSAQCLTGNPDYAKDLVAIKLALNKWEAAMMPLPAETPGRD